MNLTLLPAPAKLSLDTGHIILRAPQIVLPPAPSADTLFTAQLLQAAIGTYLSSPAPLIAGQPTSSQPIRLQLDSSAGQPETYHLAIRHDGIVLLASSESGLFYAAQTLIQILRQRRDHLPCLQIHDAPDFHNRGVMLDVSRDKVPTLKTLFDLIDLLSEWKINQLQLYMEHTFAYTHHPDVHAGASPYTAEDVLLLDAYCRQRHIQLVPNQNSFGHMERWLRLPRYIELAEAPDGAPTPWGFRWEGPFSLNPTDPRSLELLKGLYAELLPNFRSPLFNVGCDETFDIGHGRSKLAVERKGKARVYLDFLLQLQRLVQSFHRTMMFWGDIILNQPELIPELPRDLIAMEWGYESNHPFDKEGQLFADAGIPYYVCPGTSSWCSLAGRSDNCLENLRNAAQAGRRYGAFGYLNTDWGDHGHLQYLPVSYLGFAAGAAYCWNFPANRHLDIPKALDLHCFHDSASVMGKLAFELGNVYKELNLIPNASRLFRILIAPNNDQPQEIALPQLQSSLDAIDAAMAALGGARMERPDAQTIRDEFSNTAAMLRHAAHRAQWLLHGPMHTPLDLASDLRQIIGRHESLWMTRNRSGGLHDSAARLRNTLSLYK